MLKIKMPLILRKQKKKKGFINYIDKVEDHLVGTYFFKNAGTIGQNVLLAAILYNRNVYRVIFNAPIK
jgi:hypothetical protein